MIILYPEDVSPSKSDDETFHVPIFGSDRPNFRDNDKPNCMLSGWSSQASRYNADGVKDTAAWAATMYDTLHHIVGFIRIFLCHYWISGSSLR
jgi:hypothetical protein